MNLERHKLYGSACKCALANLRVSHHDPCCFIFFSYFKMNLSCATAQQKTYKLATKLQTRKTVSSWLTIKID